MVASFCAHNAGGALSVVAAAAARREHRRLVRKSLHEYQFSPMDLAALEKRTPQRSWTAGAPAFHINHLREGGRERKRQGGRKATCVCVCARAEGNVSES